MLSNQSHHECKVFLPPGSAKHRKTTVQVQILQRASPHSATNPHDAHTHTSVHVPVLCAFKAIHQRSRSVESSHSTQMFFLLQDHKSWGDESSSEGEEEVPQETEFLPQKSCARWKPILIVEFLKMVKIISTEVFLKNHLTSCLNSVSFRVRVSQQMFLDTRL